MTEEKEIGSTAKNWHYVITRNYSRLERVAELETETEEESEDEVECSDDKEVREEKRGKKYMWNKDPADRDVHVSKWAGMEIYFLLISLR